MLPEPGELHPSLHELNITPWNPAPALGLIFLLRFGSPAMAPLALAVCLADAWVRNLPVSLGVSVVLALVPAVGYRLIAEVLRRRLASRGVFDDLHGLFACGRHRRRCGTLLNSAIYVGVLWFGRLIPVSSVLDAFVRYWVGDAVGAIVSMPLLWMLLDRRGRRVCGSCSSTATPSAASCSPRWPCGLLSPRPFRRLQVLLRPFSTDRSRRPCDTDCPAPCSVRRWFSSASSVRCRVSACRR